MEKIQIYVGFDRTEPVAFHALSHSILSQSSVPVSVTPLVRNQLPVSERRDPKASTDFADTRFLVPWLNGFEGWAIFMDCDELFTVDPKALWDLRDDQFTVMVRKHDHVPEHERKFLNHPQYKYKKKNWSSLMMFNCKECKILTPAYINSTPGLDLHQFKWTEEGRIGDLPRGWNHLVDEIYWEFENPPPLLHYTNGGPWFDEFRYCAYSGEWWKVFNQMTYAEQLHGTYGPQGKGE